MGAVHEAQNLRQLLHGQVGVEQEIDGLAHAHLVQQVEEGQAGGQGDVVADGRLTHEKQLGQVGQRQLLAQVVVHVVEDIALVDLRAGGRGSDPAALCGTAEQHDQLHQLVF